MNTVKSSIYNTNYYLNVCLGSKDFKRNKGRKINPEIIKILSGIKFSKEMKVLDIGCGRGDISFYIAKYTNEVTGIDYSRDAIEIATNIKKNFKLDLRNKVKFKLMNIKKMQFKNDSFDLIVAIDVFEHLDKIELKRAMKELKRVLKPNGILFVHTGTNRVLHDFTYRYYIRPLNMILTRADRILRNKKYLPLPIDPRTPEEKVQHVNEPTYTYLNSLFNSFGFYGKIQTKIGYLKNGDKMGSRIYNFIITLYPLSIFYPLNILFGWAFVCVMRNKKG